MDISGVLKHLGIIKNELLIFGTLGQFMTHGSGVYLGQQVEPFQKMAGAGLHVCGVLLLIVFGGFYLFALMKLPGSVQELKFEESTKEALKDHQKALPKRPKKTKPQTQTP